MKALALLLLLGAAPGAQVIDSMDDAARWTAKASDSVTVNSVDTGGAVALDYDFGRVSGYAFLRRAVELTLPANYALRFKVRGTGGRNDFQIKLTDASAENVWWHPIVNFRPSAEWREITIPAGDIVFAWGPTADKVLRGAQAIEFVVARNRDGGAGRIEIDDVELVPLPGKPTPSPAAASPNDAIVALAKAGPRGAYPRAFRGEQPYWTLAGSDGGRIAALISEDAAIEPARGSYSIEPHVQDGAMSHGWHNVSAETSLAESDLPIPSVAWGGPEFRLQTTLLADSAGRAALAGYRLTNTGRTRRPLSLVLQLRPFQVNPPAQFLAQRGGVSPISAIRREGGGVAIVQPQEQGDPEIVRRLVPETAPDAIEMGREAGFAAATMTWRFDLAPGQSRFVALAMGEGAPTWDQSYAATRSHWRGVFDRVTISVPPAKQPVADSVRTALAHMLMSRDGAMLKPGTRSYNRSWIRDGAMISDALLRLGHAEAARAYADWYAPYLFASGKVPCCVDFRGADPVPENDSHGEFIYLLTQLYRFTGDQAALARDWRGLDAARRYMETLRQSERKPATPRWLYGLMPPSISHEGYSAKPQYSLWDDFWALRGYKDAAFAAEVLGKPEAAAIARQRDAFQADLHAAIAAAATHWKIDYIPGATSLGDHDATSTTMALDPAGEQARLDQRLLTGTFERYWRDFVARRDGDKGWKDYTPYEWRNVSAFVRLGWRDRVDRLIDFFMADRRPAPWNGWAEVVGRNPREVRFIGDMPHAWVASDFVRAALDLFAYEEHDAQAIVLGAGLGANWLAGGGSQIRGLRTTHGTLDLALRGDANRLNVTIGGNARPPGGFVLPWPFAGLPSPVTIDGRRASWQGRALRFPATGRTIQIVAQSQENR